MKKQERHHARLDFDMAIEAKTDAAAPTTEDLTAAGYVFERQATIHVVRRDGLIIACSYYRDAVEAATRRHYRSKLREIAA